MNVLVTGSSGHVGGAIARHLAERGCEVIGVSRRTAPHLPASIRQIQGDLAAPEFVAAMRKSVGRCGAVVHAAADLDMRLDAMADSETNCVGAHKVLQLAEAWGVSAFVYLSSVPVIGVPRERPITEDHPAAPRTPYHASKLYGEHLTAIASRQGLHAATLRLTAPVGPGMPRNRILSIFVARALAGRPLELHGQGTRRQNYVDVHDVAHAVHKCIEGAVCGLFNIAGAESVANVELARRCIAALGSASSVVYTGQPDPEDDIAWDVAIEKARTAFGYAPAHDLESSIRSVANEQSLQLKK